MPLRKAICEKFKKDNGLDYEPSQIIVSNGAKHSIFNACYALLDEGDEVIIPQPYWLTYPEVVKVCGGVPVYLDCKKENKYKFTAEELKGVNDNRTAGVVNTLTQQVLTEAALLALEMISTLKGGAIL